MNNLVQILLQKALAAAAGALVARHLADQATADQLTGYLLPAGMLLFSVVWSHVHLFNVSKPLPSPKSLGALVAFLGLSALLLTGCETALKSDKIVSVKQRCFGLVLETTSAATQTPNVKLGFVSTVWQMIPTSTNSPIWAPCYMDTFDLGQGLNPFGTEISENTGAGSVMIGTNGSASAFAPK